MSGGEEKPYSILIFFSDDVTIVEKGQTFDPELYGS